MSDSVCPRCGNPTGVWTQGKLCQRCNFDDEGKRLGRLIQNQAAAAQMEAAEAQRQAAAELAEMARRQEEERERERRRQKAAMLNDLPNQVEVLLAAATTDEKLAAAISGIAQVCDSIDERTWLFLAKATPLVAETTYVRLRALLVPRLTEWWRRRDRLGPSPVPMLKAIAKSVRYKQFSSIPLVTTGLAETLIATQSQLDVAVNQAEHVRQQLAACVSDGSTATVKVGEAVRLYRAAEVEVSTPIDRKEVEKKLRSFDAPLGAGILAAFCLILTGLGFAIGGPTRELAGTCCFQTFLLSVGLCGLLLLEPLYYRSLSGTAFKERVERAMLEKNKERRETLAKRKAELQQAESEQSRMLAAHKQLQDRLPGLEASVRHLQQRLRDIPAEVLRTHTDPLLAPILQG